MAASVSNGLMRKYGSMQYIRMVLQHLVSLKMYVCLYECACVHVKNKIHIRMHIIIQIDKFRSETVVFLRENAPIGIKFIGLVLNSLLITQNNSIQSGFRLSIACAMAGITVQYARNVHYMH